MLLLLLILGLCAPALAQDVEQVWPVTLDSGRGLDLHLRLPSADPEHRYPAIMLFGGFQGAAEILQHVKTDRPVVRASFRYPWDEPENVSLLAIPGIVQGFAQAVRDTFEGIDRLIELLREHPAVDHQRIILVGASAGAPFATIGGQSNAVPAVVIVQGFGRLRDVIAHQFTVSWSKKYGDWVAPVAWLLAALIVWWAELPHPEHHARQFDQTQQVLMINAQQDQRIPHKAIESLWSAIDASPAGSERLDLAGGHLRGYHDPAMEQIMATALSWLGERGFLPPSTHQTVFTEPVQR